MLDLVGFDNCSYEQSKALEEAERKEKKDIFDVVQDEYDDIGNSYIEE